MKKLALALALALSVPLITHAAIIDDFLGEAAKVGNPANEAEWVESIIGEEVDFAGKTPSVPYTVDGDIFTFDLAFTPDYFLVKNSTRMALFDNELETSKGVIDSSLLSEAFHFGDELTISHVSEFNRTEDKVPEPTVIALLGLGLLGVAARSKGLV